MSWTLSPTEQFNRDAKKAGKSQGGEFVSVMRNLQIYMDSLNSAKSPSLIHLGFLHSEPMGVKAIDQTGGTLDDGTKRVKMKESRLYVYPDFESKTIHLFCIGNKTSQPKDIQFSKKQVEALRKSSLGT